MNSEEIEKLKSKAFKGSTASQIQLGHSYLTGVGYDGAEFPQDYSEARRWLEMAHGKGAHTATTLLGKIYEEGNGVPENIPQAARLYQIAAEHGSFLSCIYLARLYAQGGGVPQSTNQASDWYEKALSFGDEIDLDEEIAEAKSYLSRNTGQSG
jgi:uncharacterized protein